MLTRIPFFKELIVSSFSCDACGFENREAQLGGRVQEKGVRFTLEVTTAEVRVCVVCVCVCVPAGYGVRLCAPKAAWT